MVDINLYKRIGIDVSEKISENQVETKSVTTENKLEEESKKNKKTESKINLESKEELKKEKK